MRLRSSGCAAGVQLRGARQGACHWLAAPAAVLHRPARGSLLQTVVATEVLVAQTASAMRLV